MEPMYQKHPASTKYNLLVRHYFYPGVEQHVNYEILCHRVG